MGPSPSPSPRPDQPSPGGISVVGGTVVFVPFRGGDYFQEAYCNIDGVLFPAQWTGSGFNCIGVDVGALGDGLRAVPIELILFPDCAQTPCDVRTDYFVTSDSACLLVDSPCANLVAVGDQGGDDSDDFLDANFTRADYSSSASFTRRIRDVRNGFVYLRGDFLPTEINATTMDPNLVCVYSFYDHRNDPFRVLEPRAVEVVNVETITPNYDAFGVAHPAYTCSFDYKLLGLGYEFNPGALTVEIGWRVNGVVETNPSADCFVVVSPASALSASAVVVVMFASIMAIFNF